MNDTHAAPLKSMRSAITPMSTSLRLPQVPVTPSAMGTPSNRTLANSTRARHVTASEELAFIVDRNRATREMADETKAAVRYVTTENGMMEELLREKHRMLTNTDLAVIVGSVMQGKDGGVNSSILAARRPPELRCRRLALGAHGLRSSSTSPAPGAVAQVADGTSRSTQRSASVSTLRASPAVGDSPARVSLADHRQPSQRPPSNRIPTGRVNFQVLTAQQQVDLRRTEDSRKAYDRMINEFVSKQQGLSDRFADIL